MFLAYVAYTIMESWNIWYVVSSEDYINGTGEGLSNDVYHCIASMKKQDTQKLSDWIEIAIGMKAMILFNLSTEAEIANRTQATMQDIVLDPREEICHVEEDDVCTIWLKYSPALILFEPEGGCQVSSAFRDKRDHWLFLVPEGQIPITPSSVTFTVILKNSTKISINHTQYYTIMTLCSGDIMGDATCSFDWVFRLRYYRWLNMTYIYQGWCLLGQN